MSVFSTLARWLSALHSCAGKLMLTKKLGTKPIATTHKSTTLGLFALHLCAPRLMLTTKLEMKSAIFLKNGKESHLNFGYLK